MKTANLISQTNSVAVNLQAPRFFSFLTAKSGSLLFALFMLLLIATTASAQQPWPGKPDTVVAVPAINHQPRVVTPMKLDGPRVGFTGILPGKTADRLRSTFDASPFVTQFGWQAETRYFSLESGTAGLIEWVFLVGGLEQKLFLPSVSMLVGMRNKNGVEFGFGPNLSIAGPAFVFAAGVTFQSDDVNFPVNLAFVPSTDGARISLLVGFNARHR